MSESSQSSSSCPQCGAALPSVATKGLCPKCLMAEAMAPTEGEAEPLSPRKSLTPEELAPHFPQLEILECLGRGGMGVVYKARQKSLNRFIALKLLAPERAIEPGFADRFAREAQALAALNHPHIVAVHDFGQAGGFFYLLMEFVDGVNLRQAMKAGRFTPEQALAVVPPVCEALQYAHEHGIVHRDIKPENLLLDKDGRVKIADFGIAKMLHADDEDADLAESQPAGTPQYMAPEQKEHRRTDHRADIYSLGVVLYELLTGEMPGAKLQPPSRKVQIDVRLDEIVLRALESKPELRYQTAGEFQTRVETFFSTPHSSPANEAPTERIDQKVSTSSVTGPRLIKVGTSTLVTPAHLATARGQFFGYATRGQLVLDDRQLTHTAPPALVSAVTVIPLAAIRDVSIGKYPLSMNPLGIDLLSVTYEEGGQRKQVLLSPMEGWFAMPSTWDARVAEWATAIREAVTAATGRAPTTTASEQLGVPGSHFGLLTMFLMPLVPLGVFLTFLTMLSSPGTLPGRIGLMSLFIFGMAVAGFLLVFLQRRRAKSPPGSGRALSPLRLVFGVLALIGALLGLSVLIYVIPSKSVLGVSNFTYVPVGVSNNVVIVDVKGEVARGGAEVQAALDGPGLPPTLEAEFGETPSAPFAGTLVKPTRYIGNRPWRLWSAGPQTWRLGFVLPNDALAKEAFANLRPIGPLPAEPRRAIADTLFQVVLPGGAEYHASLNVIPPVSSADPRWVEVMGQTRQDAHAVTLSWEVLAAQAGTAQFSRVGSPIIVLIPQPRTKLYSVTAGLELTRLDAERVLFVRRIGQQTLREEITGNFRELADELLRTKTTSAKTVSGIAVELCQFQGKPFTVQVHGQPSTVSAPVPVKVVGRWVPFYGVIGLCVLSGAVIFLLMRKSGTMGKVVLLLGTLLLIAGLALAVLLYFWNVRSGGMSGIGSIRISVAGFVALLITLGVIGLIVVLACKRGTAGKVVALVLGAPFLLLVVAVVTLMGSRKVSRDFGPGAGLERLSQSGQMVLESSYPVPPHQHPPGEVQQTQNGFRLTLPASQLATFEFSIRQADDTWQLVPSLTALVATGERGRYSDSLWWSVRRGNEAHTTNQLWFWTVGANESGGHPMPQLADHGTNFTHHVPHPETLDWWHLAAPPRVEMKPGTQKTLTLFRTFGTATARGGQLKEARIFIRCETLPSGMPVSAGQHLVQAGLAAQAILEKTLPAANAATAVSP